MEIVMNLKDVLIGLVYWFMLACVWFGLFMVGEKLVDAFCTHITCIWDVAACLNSCGSFGDSFIAMVAKISFPFIIILTFVSKALGKR